MVLSHQWTNAGFATPASALQTEQDENGAWRRVIPPELMPKSEVVLRDSAGAQSAQSK